MSEANTRLAIVLPSLSHGGAERVATELIARLARDGVQICLVTIATDDTDFYAVPDSVQRVTLGLQAESNGLASALTANLRRVKALRRTIRDFAPDTVLAFTGRVNVLTIMAMRGMTRDRRRLVVSERIYPPAMPLGRSWDGLRRRLYGRADLVLAQTERAAQWLKQNTSAREVAVIPNPLWTTLAQSGPSVSPQTQVNVGEKLLLAIGRLSPQKGFDMLLDAFRVVAEKHPAWKLVILGDGERRAELEASARGLRVSFLGVLGNTQAWYGRADLFVLSSRFEGFPNVLLEALASGTPAVGFDCPAGVADLIKNDVNGVLVPEGDVAALAGALDTLMRDDGYRARLAARTRESVGRFNEDAVMEDWWRALALQPRSPSAKVQ